MWALIFEVFDLPHIRVSVYSSEGGGGVGGKGT